jgi:hypothetical protein
MLFGEIIAAYCENYTEYKITVCKQNVELYYVRTCGTYSNHWALKGKMADMPRQSSEHGSFLLYENQERSPSNQTRDR